MADLKVAVLVIETERLSKCVQLVLATADGTYQTSLVFEPEAAQRMGHALIQSGKHAESGIVVAKAVPVIGNA